MSNIDSLIISGVHLDLTDALKAKVKEQMAKIYLHEERIIRVRIELEFSSTHSHLKEFVAKGYIEIIGPPMVAQVAGEDLYACIDKLSEKLDRMIRRRHRLTRVKRKHPHPIEIPDADIPKAASWS